jgi:hypothetical protein
MDYTKQPPVISLQVAAFSRAGKGDRTLDPQLGKLMLYH